MSVRKKKSKKEEEELAELCENPKEHGWRYGWDICTNPENYGIEPINGPMYPLFLYQDACIEHKDHEVPIVSYYTEAVGDIFRELSKLDIPYIAADYIEQKLNRLQDLRDSWNVMDEKDKQRLITEEKKEILRGYQKKVNKFYEIANKESLKPLIPTCKGYEEVRELQSNSVWVMQQLVKWGLDEIPIGDIQYNLWRYIGKVKSYLDQREKSREEAKKKV